MVSFALDTSPSTLLSLNTDNPDAPMGSIYRWLSASNISLCKSYSSQPYASSCPLVIANYQEVGAAPHRRFCRFWASRLGAVREFYGWTDYRYVRLDNGTEITVVSLQGQLLCIDDSYHASLTCTGPPMYCHQHSQLYQPCRLGCHGLHWCF